MNWNKFKLKWIEMNWNKFKLKWIEMNWNELIWNFTMPRRPEIQSHIYNRDPFLASGCSSEWDQPCVGAVSSRARTNSNHCHAGSVFPSQWIWTGHQESSPLKHDRILMKWSSKTDIRPKDPNGVFFFLLDLFLELFES
jgi:hypothetical protein